MAVLDPRAGEPGVDDRLRRRAVRRARNPTGPAGHVVGWIFGRRSSNVTRNRWAVGLLGLAPEPGSSSSGAGRASPSPRRAG